MHMNCDACGRDMTGNGEKFRDNYICRECGDKVIRFLHENDPRRPQTAHTTNTD